MSEPTNHGNEDAFGPRRDAERLFSERFQNALTDQRGDAAAACGQLYAEAADNQELNRAIVLLHLTYFAEGLGREAASKHEGNQKLN